MLPLIQKGKFISYSKKNKYKGESYDWRAAQTTSKNEKINN